MAKELHVIAKEKIQKILEENKINVEEVKSGYFETKVTVVVQLSDYHKVVDLLKDWNYRYFSVFVYCEEHFDRILEFIGYELNKVN